MKKENAVIIAGAVILIFGIIFYLQGRSVLGPQTSFMYSNPDWINYGFQIAISGTIVVAIGIMGWFLCNLKR